MIDIDGDTITFGEERAVLRHPVAESVETDGVLVVLLDVPTGTIDNRNVVGFTTTGERRWEIDPISDDPSADQSYVNLFEEDGGVWVYNPVGAKCRIDPHSGALLETQQQKW